jgi:hypothetical protein
LTPRKALAAQLLAAGWSQLEAAVMVGTSPRSIRRWLHEDDEFQKAYVLESRILSGQARARIRAVQGNAIDTVIELLTGSSPALRLSAAKVLLANARDIDVDELELRIDSAERSLSREKGDD